MLCVCTSGQFCFCLLASLLPCLLSCLQEVSCKWPSIAWNRSAGLLAVQACIAWSDQVTLSLALCASWSDVFDQVVSLSVYVYISACCMIGLLQSVWCKVDVQRLMEVCWLACALVKSASVELCFLLLSRGLSSLSICLVKSASVELCFLLLSSGLSLYIYMYACCRDGCLHHPLMVQS